MVERLHSITKLKVTLNSFTLVCTDNEACATSVLRLWASGQCYNIVLTFRFEYHRKL